MAVTPGAWFSHPLTSPAFMTLSCFSAARPVLVTNADSTHTVSYFQTVAGDYKLSIMHGAELISGETYPLRMVPGEFEEAFTTVEFGGGAVNRTGSESGVIRKSVMAGDEFAFAVTVRDRWQNELTGGDGLVTCSVTLLEPVARLRAAVQNTGGKYAFQVSPTITGTYDVVVMRTMVPLNSIQMEVNIFPADPYPANCKTYKLLTSGDLGPALRPAVAVTGPVQQAPTTPASFSWGVKLYDEYDNVIDKPLNETDFMCVVRTNYSVGAEISVRPLSPVLIALSSNKSSTFEVSLELMRRAARNATNRTAAAGAARAGVPVNTHMMHSPFVVSTTALNCNPGSSRIFISGGRTVVAGAPLAVRLEVVDRFMNPCKPMTLELSVQTPVFRNMTLSETVEERIARQEDYVRRQAQLIQMGISPDNAVQDPAQRQWLHSRLNQVAYGEYLMDETPLISGEFIFFITLNGVALTQRAMTVTPAPISMRHSFISHLVDANVDASSTFFVQGKDLFSNSLGNRPVTLCSEIQRHDGLEPEKRNKVVGTATALGDAKFNVTLQTTISGSYDVRVYLSVPANESVPVSCGDMDLSTTSNAVSLCRQAPSDSSASLPMLAQQGLQWYCYSSYTSILPMLPAAVSPAKFLVFPDSASLNHSFAHGNGLLGGFRGSTAVFRVTVRDRYGNVRDLHVTDDVAVYVVDANATSYGGELAPGSRLLSESMVQHLVGALGVNQSADGWRQKVGCGVNTRQANLCDELVSHLLFAYYERNVQVPPFTEPAIISRSTGVRGDHLATYNVINVATYQVNVFINEQRLPNSMCENNGFPQGAVLTTAYRRPNLMSPADATDEVILAGTEQVFNVQLVNEILYNLNFGGNGGALVVYSPNHTSPGVRLPSSCGGSPRCPELPYTFTTTDNDDGSYSVSYRPTVPGAYSIRVLLNMTHSSIPDVPCEVGALSAARLCSARYNPVCGVDGVTYPNECRARDFCVDIVYDAVCEEGRAIPIEWLTRPLVVFETVVIPDVTSPDVSVVALLHPTTFAKITVDWSGLTRTTGRTFCDQEDGKYLIHRCPGQTFTFVTDAKDRFGNPIIHRPASEEFVPNVTTAMAVSPLPHNDVVYTDLRNGTHMFSIRLTVSGMYVVSLAVNDVYINPGPFRLKVDQPHRWVNTTSFISLDRRALSAGGNYNMILHPRDIYDNVISPQTGPYPGPLTSTSIALVLDPPKPPGVRIDPRFSKSVAGWNRANSSITVRFAFTLSGSYKMSVNYNGFPGRFAAYTDVDVVVSAAPAAASKSTVYGPGLQGGVAGVGGARAVHIRAKDQYGNDADSEAPNDSFRVVVTHDDSKVAVLWGEDLIAIYSRQFEPRHADAQYQAALVSYATPTYNFEYTPRPAGRYSWTIILINRYAAENVIAQSQFDLQLSPAPVITYCRLSSTAVNILLVFSVTTNYGRAGDSSDCSEVFEASTSDKLGEESKCAWLDRKQLLVTLGMRATIYVGDIIALKAHKLLSEDENSAAVSDTAILRAPEVSSPPTVTLSAPAVVGQCDALFIDASASYGSGGRTMGYLWSVEAPSGANVAAVYDRLHQISCSGPDLSHCTEAASSGRIASDLLVPGFSYKFSVRVTNFWGASASASVVVYKSQSPIPGIMIEGESVRTVTRSDRVLLRTIVELSDCLEADQQMDYAWSVLPGSPPVTLDPAVAQFRDLVLQPGMLESGQVSHGLQPQSLRTIPTAAVS